MNDFFDNQQIFHIIWKRRIHFVVIGLVAILLSAIFSGSLFITPKYRSAARVYPSNLGEMSEESRTEQMLEILNSQDIKLKMFDAFDLWQVYKVDKNDPLHISTMLGLYNKNISTSKTEYETVEIKVMDKDPFRAASMCDSIIRFYDRKVHEMHSTKRWELVKILQDNMKIKLRERDSLMVLINENRQKYQILDYTNQVKEVTRGYMEALATGRESTAGGREIKRLYENLAEKGAETSLVETGFRRSSRALDSLTHLYEINLSEAKKDITYCFVVEKPLPADKKAYPVRWLIVFFATVSALFMALLVMLVLDYKVKK